MLVLSEVWYSLVRRYVKQYAAIYWLAKTSAKGVNLKENTLLGSNFRVFFAFKVVYYS